MKSHSARRQTAARPPNALRAGGGPLKLLEAGSEHGDATPVVLLHGLGSSAEDWALQVPALASERRTLAVDLGGHGRSGRSTSRTSVAAMAADLESTLRARRALPAHLVGLSLGAAVALQFGADYPQDVRSLTLVNGFAQLRLGPSGWGSALGRLFWLLTGRMDRLGDWVARSIFLQGEQAALRRLAARRIAGNDRMSYLRALWALATFNMRGRLGEVTAPALVVAGHDDPLVPLTEKRRLARGLPRGRLVELPSSGHATPLDRPARFNETLQAFLAAADRRSL